MELHLPSDELAGVLTINIGDGIRPDLQHYVGAKDLR
jgi:hypothetical protein